MGNTKLISGCQKRGLHSASPPWDKWFARIIPAAKISDSLEPLVDEEIHDMKVMNFKDERASRAQAVHRLSAITTVIFYDRWYKNLRRQIEP